MVRNKNPCFIEAQREFCETHHIFYGVVLPAELTECKAETFTRLFPSVDAFSVVCRRGMAGMPLSQGSVGQHL
jgi:hypothetical protein